MHTIKPQLSSFVGRQLPEFIRADYPAFVEFLEAYYEYLEQTEQRNLATTRDIDESLDSFIEYFKGELDYNGLFYENIDQRFLLTKIKQVFAAKGSEASYKFIFRILFNKDVDIYYPSTSILRPSDGKWDQEVSVFVNAAPGFDLTQVESNYITISTPTKNITAFVLRVRELSDGVCELFLERSFFGNIEEGANVKYNSSTIGIITTTTVSLKIEIPGQGFRVGELVEVKTASGSGTVLKVSRVNPTGGIVEAQIIRFGVGYISEFFGSLQSRLNVNTPITASTFTIDQNGAQVFSLPSDDITGGTIDSGYLSKPDYWGGVSPASDFADGTYVGEVLQSFYNEFASESTLGTDFALVRFQIGTIARYPGYYTSNDGFLSDNIYLQDGYYYQAYSYVLQVSEQLDSYREFVKSYLHPAGLALFAEYSIENEIQLGTSIQSILSYAAQTFLESVVIGESFSFDYDKDFADSLIASDSAEVALLFAVGEDTFTVSDSLEDVSLTKGFNEVVTLSDANMSFAFDIALSDLFASSDAIQNKTVSKSLTDSFSLTADDITVGFFVALEDNYSGMTDTDFTYSINSNLSDSFNVNEAIEVSLGVELFDTVAGFTDAASLDFGQSSSDSINTTDDLDLSVSFNLTDSNGMSDADPFNQIVFDPYDEGSYSSEEYSGDQIINF